MRWMDEVVSAAVARTRNLCHLGYAFLSEDELQVLSYGSLQNSLIPLTMEDRSVVAGEPAVTM
jgi:hypothetical protein